MTRPSSKATVAVPARTIPTCSTPQSFVPTVGATCTDHFQPGSYDARPMVIAADVDDLQPALLERADLVRRLEPLAQDVEPRRRHIRKTPKRVSGIGALSAAEIPRPSTVRVSAGAITPSSHSRAVE